jgi:hypothetical protein
MTVTGFILSTFGEWNDRQEARRPQRNSSVKSPITAGLQPDATSPAPTESIIVLPGG